MGVIICGLAAPLAYGEGELDLMDPETDNVNDACLGDLNPEGLTDSEEQIAVLNDLLESEEQPGEPYDPSTDPVAQAIAVLRDHAEIDYNLAMNALGIGVTAYVDALHHVDECSDTIGNLEDLQTQLIFHEDCNDPAIQALIQDTAAKLTIWREKFDNAIGQLSVAAQAFDRLERDANVKLNVWENLIMLYDERVTSQSTTT